jgi:hypothetical protein
LYDERDQGLPAEQITPDGAAGASEAVGQRIHGRAAGGVVQEKQFLYICRPQGFPPAIAIPVWRTLAFRTIAWTERCRRDDFSSANACGVGFDNFERVPFDGEDASDVAGFLDGVEKRIRYPE